eukprot:914544-Amphidinium_carterae.1
MHRVNACQVQVCQLLQYPWLDARLPRRCLTAGLRVWCLHRHILRLAPLNKIVIGSRLLLLANVLWE